MVQERGIHGHYVAYVRMVFRSLWTYFDWHCAAVIWLWILVSLHAIQFLTFQRFELVNYLSGTIDLSLPVLYYCVLLRVSIMDKLTVVLFVLCTSLRRPGAVSPAHWAWFAHSWELSAAWSTTLLVCFGAPDRLSQHGAVIETSQEHCCSSSDVLQLGPQCCASSKHSIPISLQFLYTTELSPNDFWFDFHVPKLYVFSTGMDYHIAYKRSLKTTVFWTALDKL